MSPTTDILQQIRARYDADSRRAGRLVCVSRFLYLHYAVAISDTHAVSWQPERDNALRAKGIFGIERLTAQFREAEDARLHPRSVVLDALLASAPAFHQQWDYCLRTWNCEHWARLVTSGVAASIQCERAAFGLAKALGGLVQNLEAAALLQSALRFNLLERADAEPPALAA